MFNSLINSMLKSMQILISSPDTNLLHILHHFLSDPGVPGVRSMGPDVSHSVQDYVADLTDVTLADEDSNSIPTDDVNRAFLGNMAMQVATSGGQQ